MAVDARIARRYAQALFDTALRYNVVDSVESDLATFDSLIKNNAEFSQFLLAPYTSREEKAGILERVFADRITALTLQVLRVMLEKRREDEIGHVYDQFVRLRREHENVVHVTVTSSEELTGDQRDALVARMSALLKKKVEADFQVDPRIIGGVRVAYQNFVLDGSARGALNTLRERLKYDLLKRLS